MKKTCHIQTARLVPNSAARWRAIQNNLANNIQRNNKKEIHHIIRYSSTSKKKKTPQHKSTLHRSKKKKKKKKKKKLKFEDNLIVQHKHNTSLSLRCSRKDRTTGNKLYKANHLCMMKLAIIKEELQDNHHLKISFNHSKDDLSY